MRNQQLLMVLAVCTGLGTVSGCANRSTYPQYPQQAYQYTGQTYPGQPYAGQPYSGQQVMPIQPSPIVGQQPQGTMQAGFNAQPNYPPQGYYGQPPGYVAPPPGYAVPPPGYAAPPASSYNSPGNTPFVGR